MSGHTVAYLANGFAWSLGGILFVLTYQRIASWYRKNRGLGEYRVTSTTYFGTLVVGFTVITALFSISTQIRQIDYQRCAANIQADNAAASNAKTAELNKALISLRNESQSLHQTLLRVAASADRAEVLVALADLGTHVSQTVTDINATVRYNEANPSQSSTKCRPPTN